MPSDTHSTILELGMYGMSVLFGGEWSMFTPFPIRTLIGTEVAVALLRMDEPPVWRVVIVKSPSELSSAAVFEITSSVDHQVSKAIL